MDKKSEGKTGKNFGFLATRLTLRIYVPQRGKAMLGGLTLTDGFHCHGSRNTKNGTWRKKLPKQVGLLSVRRWFSLPKFGWKLEWISHLRN